MRGLRLQTGGHEMTQDKNGDKGLTGLADQAREAVALGQAIGLGMLQAEIEALTHLLPGQTETDAEREARIAAEAAALEDGFDNMPV